MTFSSLSLAGTHRIQKFGLLNTDNGCPLFLHTRLLRSFPDPPGKNAADDSFNAFLVFVGSEAYPNVFRKARIILD